MSNDSIKPLNPPVGSSDKAKKYIDWLTKLIDADKLSVTQSDLARFNIETMQNHYRISLKDYEIEVSHSKNPSSGEDMYVMLFNNLGNVTNECERVILSYLHLTQDQFLKFRTSADKQLRKKKEAEEAAKFEEVMAPVDQMLQKIEVAPAQTTNPVIPSVNEESLANASTNNPTSVGDSSATPQNDNVPQPNLTPNLVKPPLPEEPSPAAEPTPSDGISTTPGVFTPDPNFSTPPAQVTVELPADQNISVNI